MIEVLVLFWLARKLGSMAEAKGHSETKWKVITIVLWFGGEITGAIIGAALSGGETVLLYGMGLGGAVIGAFTAWILVSALPQTLVAENPAAKVFD